MADFVERRKYVRFQHPVCKVYMSIDKRHWEEIEICDLSAGGIRFISKHTYDINGMIYFNILIYRMFSEFDLSLEGPVVRKQVECNNTSYSVKFININRYMQVQLDEVLRSRSYVDKSTLGAHEDGMYTYLLTPKLRRSKAPKYR